jgi:hypothetical protein
MPLLSANQRQQLLPTPDRYLRLHCGYLGMVVNALLPLLLLLLLLLHLLSSTALPSST